MKNNILFVCKYNRFRSKVAEVIFKKYNKNSKYKAKSSGLFPGRPITEDIFSACEESGFKINKNFRGTTRQLLRWSDIIIIIADNIPASLFYEEEKNDGKKIIQWKIKDVAEDKKRTRKQKIKQIEKKVKQFVKGLR